MNQAHTISANADTAATRAGDLAGSEDTPNALHQLVLAQLDDDQAQELVSIPLEGKSSMADHMVIASGRSTRQVGAMAHKLAEKIKLAKRLAGIKDPKE